MVLRVLIVALVVLVALTAARLHSKRLAGPPDEFHLHTLRDPANTKLQERSITQYVWLSADAANDAVYAAVLNVPNDGVGEFVFSYASQFSEWITLAMDDPHGRPVDLDNVAVKDKFPVGVGKEVPMLGFIIRNAVKGVYRLTLTTKPLTKHEIARLEAHKYPHAIFTFINDDSLMIESHLTTYVIAKGKKLGVSARVVDNSKKRFGSPGAVSVASASLNLMTPSGQDVHVPMNDDGVHGDVLAKDGIFYAEVAIDTEGQYIAQPILSGFFNAVGAEEETEFMRSTQHLVTASPIELEILGKATIARKDSERTLIHLAVSSNGAADGLRAYTEIYGTKDGKLVPVAWLGGRVDVKDGYITLELNSRWLLRAGASGSLVLKNTYIADLKSSFPIATFLGEIAVDNSANIPVPGFNALLSLNMHVPITKEMRQGVNPLNATKRLTSKSGLVLVPGYCATINPWKRNADDFTDAYFFDEPELNVSNDEYAQKVIAFAESQGLDSFGLVGHSQGGVVALHIHNYYFSALEAGTGSRLIQSVGTPFQGSTVAGSAADLGRALGYGCGANSDLSRDGAVNWLAGISTEARKDVYFFTTTYKQRTFFGDYCSLATNTILQWPNDGVTELKYAKLEGANDMGNEEKWCHTTDLKYPAQYDDHDRNADMNKNAAR